MMVGGPGPAGRLRSGQAAAAPRRRAVRMRPPAAARGRREPADDRPPAGGNPQMTGPRHIVVVGAGLAGLRTIEELRGRDYAGQVTLVGAEARLPYDRPPLS